MTVTPLVSTEDLATWLGVTFSDPEVERAGLLLIAVSALVLSEAGTAGQAWTDPSVTPEEIRTVVFGIAGRVWRNPDFATSVSVTRGPFGKQLVFADPMSVGLYLGRGEKEIVARKRIKPRGLWNFGTTRNDPVDLPWNGGFGFGFFGPDGPPFVVDGPDFIEDPGEPYMDDFPWPAGS